MELQRVRPPTPAIRIKDTYFWEHHLQLAFLDFFPFDENNLNGYSEKKSQY